MTIPKAAQHCSSAAVWFRVRLPVISLPSITSLCDMVQLSLKSITAVCKLISNLKYGTLVVVDVKVHT